MHLFRTDFMLNSSYYYYSLLFVMKRLPASVQDIADVIGRDDALYLIGQLPQVKRSNGGNEVLLYVPTLQRLTPDHRLSKILGFPLARKFSLHFGGHLLKPANCNGLVKEFRNKSIVLFWEQGHTIEDIASIFDMTTKYTKKILQDLGYNIYHITPQDLQNVV